MAPRIVHPKDGSLGIDTLASVTHWVRAALIPQNFWAKLTCRFPGIQRILWPPAPPRQWIELGPCGHTDELTQSCLSEIRGRLKGGGMTCPKHLKASRGRDQAQTASKTCALSRPSPCKQRYEMGGCKSGWHENSENAHSDYHMWEDCTSSSLYMWLRVVGMIYFPVCVALLNISIPCIYED